MKKSHDSPTVMVWRETTILVLISVFIPAFVAVAAGLPLGLLAIYLDSK